jgi:glycine hydroxymethyltransferase
MHVIAAKAVAFHEAQSLEFREYQQQIVSNAKALAAALAQQGFRIVSGGTDTHLMLVDLTGRDITGRDASDFLGRVNITVNKNLIPYDSKSPLVTSGIRLGTAAVTTRGMKEPQMDLIADIMHDVLRREALEHPQPRLLREARARVAALTKEFPLYR